MRFLFLLVILFVVVALPIIPVSEGGLTVALVDSAGLVPCGEKDNPCNACHAMTMVNDLISYLFTIVSFLAVMVMMYAGFKLVTSQGNASAWEEAKGMLTNIIVGFVIVLSAWLVVDTIMKGLLDSKAGFGTWNKLSTDSCNAPLNFNPDNATKQPGSLTPAQSSSAVQAGCPTCVAVSGPTCKNNASCTVSSEYGTKLSELTSASGEDLVITEAYPPTRTHQASCHSNGTCTDVVFADRNFTSDRITAFQNAAAAKGMRAVYEPGPGGSCAGISNCLPNSKTKATGDHFSLYIQ